MNTTPSIDRSVLRQAAQWLVRLHSGEAGPQDHAACAHWRSQHPAHEHAWQRAERMAAKFGAVPSAIGVPVLGRPQTQRTNRRAALRTLALLATAAPTAWLGWRHAPWQVWTADYSTAVGERREVTLADGSTILLDTASAINITFDSHQRKVQLRQGAILATTAADTQSAPALQRPFTVHTAQGQLRALGTRFSVRQDGDAHQPGPIHVAVIEGAVEVTPWGASRPALVLPAGRQTVLSAEGAQAPQPVDIAAQGWTQGVLHADGMRLDDFCAELARYRAGVIRCAPEVAQLRISGMFQLRDTDYALTMLATTLPVQVVLRTRFWVTVVPA
ncbi:FecR domain-containing protein [Pantoea sp. 18069]|uniref:FecR domain-containing protein n=1 Tax=Pantoea sp. 18069 TaxID=2681415 RepID=UPI001358DF16|nr:FecR domain-containing protein [Pantoea sp. 18069]